MHGIQRRNATRIFATVLGALVVALCCFCLAGCGRAKVPAGSSSALVKASNEATIGSRVSVSGEVIFWGQENYLCSALIDSDGTIYDEVVEAGMSSDVLGIAAYDDYMYCADEDGFYRYPLSAFSEGGTASGEQISSRKIAQGFQIYDDYIYYRYGNTLYRIPTDGGEEAALYDGITDFSIYDGKIYCTTDDGGLYEVPIGGEGVCLANIEIRDAQLAVTDDYIFCKGKSSSDMYNYGFSAGAGDVLTVTPAPDPYGTIWALDSILLYPETNSSVCRADLGDSTVYSVKGDDYFIVDKSQGTVAGRSYYGFNSYSGKLFAYDFDTNTCVAYDMASKLDAMVQAASIGSSEPSPSASTAPAPSSSTPVSYGITDDWSGCYGKGWYGELPEDWRGFVGAKVNDDGNSVVLFVGLQEDKGYGGKLVSLVRSNEANPSYPSYDKVHTFSDGSFLYAIYPTDVQYDPNDAGQYPACERAVSSFLKKLEFTD